MGDDECSIKFITADTMSKWYELKDNGGFQDNDTFCTFLLKNEETRQTQPAKQPTINSVYDQPLSTDNYGFPVKVELHEDDNNDYVDYSEHGKYSYSSSKIKESYSKWAETETSCVLTIWGRPDVQTDLQQGRRHVYKNIAHMLCGQGYYKSPNQVKSKLSNLCKEYLRVKKGGEKKVDFKFYDLIDVVLGSKDLNNTESSLSDYHSLEQTQDDPEQDNDEVSERDNGVDAISDDEEEVEEEVIKLKRRPRKLKRTRAATRRAVLKRKKKFYSDEDDDASDIDEDEEEVVTRPVKKRRNLKRIRVLPVTQDSFSNAETRCLLDLCASLDIQKDLKSGNKRAIISLTRMYNSKGVAKQRTPLQLKTKVKLLRRLYLKAKRGLTDKRMDDLDSNCYDLLFKAFGPREQSSGIPLINLTSSRSFPSDPDGEQRYERWSHEEVKYLLILYSDSDVQNDLDLDRRHVYKNLSKKMNDKGFPINRSSSQVKAKLVHLKRLYFKIKRGVNVGSSGGLDKECFEIIDQVLGNKDVKGGTQILHEFRCKQCHQPFEKKSEYKAHLVTSPQCKGATQLKFLCNVCGVTLSSRNSLSDHQLAAHGVGRSIVCRSCDKRFGTRGQLKTHMNKVHYKKNSCSFCDMVFVHKNTLDHHVNFVHLQKPLFTCKICGNNFYSKMNYKCHVKNVHGGENGKRTFLCRRCMLRFATQEELNAHEVIELQLKYQRKHNLPSGERCPLHFCRFCGYPFWRPHELRAHELNHTGEKPYPCGQCDQRFRSKESLSTHIQATHNGGIPKKFSCDRCNKKFQRKFGLTRHMRRHHSQQEMMDYLFNQQQHNNNNGRGATVERPRTPTPPPPVAVQNLPHEPPPLPPQMAVGPPPRDWHSAFMGSLLGTGGLYNM